MNRLEDLYSYDILDTPPEQALDDFVEIASAIYEAPVAIISFIDDKRQWFKAKKGIKVSEVPVEGTLCQYVLSSPKRVLVIEDLESDARFKDHFPLTGIPGTRFYAGATLKSQHGNVLGTVSVMDYKPKNIPDIQHKALGLIAKKVMNYIETRRFVYDQEKEIDTNAIKLKKLTDFAPGALFKFQISPTGEKSFVFISEGITKLIPQIRPLDLKENAELLLKYIYPEDRKSVMDSLMKSYLDSSVLDIEYRIDRGDGEISWNWVRANPERSDNGDVIWYGTFQDISQKKDYLTTLEKILFDVSHVIRKPIVNMMGLIDILQNIEDTEKGAEKYVRHLKTVTMDLENYTRKLNEDYSRLKNSLIK
ncbi:PAS domain-containing protein [Negadavirga shengliensis]|uniref:PAS domain-containing protein n=1 Tax=Negadavirga shengliensis TaxID=1389218 RepID=A0ABV9T071_9BACT